MKLIFFWILLPLNLSALVFQRPMVVYGTDDRRDVYEYSGTAIEAMSSATLAMFDKPYIKWDSKQKVYVIDPTSYGQQENLCPGERFWHQPAAASCTGFLVGPRTLVTAGHCVTYIDCEKSYWVLGYRMQNERQVAQQFSQDKVFRCSKLLLKEHRKFRDYAVMELDRDVVGVQPLKLSQENLMPSDSVFVIGYPDGLPAKVAANATVRSWHASGNCFLTNLDTFGGNSGSPVFSHKKYEVVGIMVRGDRDFVKVGNCNKVKTCTDADCEGEQVTNISIIRQAISSAGVSSP